MVDHDDSLAVRQSINGDLHAFEVLFERYQKPVFNAVLRIVLDYDDATDVTQSAFIKAYRNLSQYNEKYKFFSWLYRIAVNESLNFIKAKRRDGEPVADVRANDRQPDERMLDDERDRQVQDALMRLTEDQRTVIVLYHFQDMSYGEIAQVLGIPEKRVKSRLFEGRSALKNILEPVKNDT